MLLVQGHIEGAQPQLFNNSLSVALPLREFPTSCPGTAAAQDAMQMSDVDSLEVVEAAIQGLDLLLEQLEGPRREGRTRRRRYYQVRKDCEILRDRLKSQSAISMVWNSTTITFTQFLQESPVDAVNWEKAEVYFTQWGQTWVKNLETAFNNRGLPSTVALDLLRSFLRKYMQAKVRVQAVQGVHTASLTRGKTALKLYIPQGQIDQCNYEVQTFKNHIVWLIKEARLLDADNQTRIEELGEFFLVSSSSLSLTRQSLLPKVTEFFNDTEAEEVPVIAVAADGIHEHVFSYNCFREAAHGCQETIQPDMNSIAASSSSAPSQAPTSTNMQALRSFLNLGCPPGAEKTNITFNGLLSEDQKAARIAISKASLSVLDCIAGAGKTKIIATMVAALWPTLKPSEYIAVVAPNKPMVHRLLTLARTEMPGAKVAPAGVIWQDGTPVDTFLEYTDNQANANLPELMETVRAGQRAVDTAEADATRHRNRGWWQDWIQPWRKLCLAHAMLQVHLFLHVYTAQAEGRSKVVEELQVLMCTADFLRKLLGQAGDWSRVFKKKTLKFLFVDEVHQETFLRLSALLSLTPRAALFGDSKQEHVRPMQANDLGAENSFNWINRRELKKIQLPVTYRLGPAITAALRATGDYPDAKSAAGAPQTTLLPLFFERADNVRSAGREICMAPIMYTHLLFSMCIEICLACEKGVYGDIAIIVYYNVQKLFLEEHLIASCLSCVQAVAQSMGVDLTEAGRDMLNKVRVYLPAAVGGLEFSVVFLLLPRRSATDTTYQGNHMLSPGWRYVALTRATERCYVLLEILGVGEHHQSQERKAVQWFQFIEHCKDEVWPELGVEHYSFISDRHPWAAWPSNVFTSRWFRQLFPTSALERLQACVRHCAEHVSRLNTAKPSKETQPPSFQTLLNTKSTLLEAARAAQNAPRQVTYLPDLCKKYPIAWEEHGVLDQTLLASANDWLEEFAPFFVDAMCVQVRSQSQISVSLPLLVGSHASWKWAPDPSTVAHALFISWLGAGSVPPHLAALTTRHKKQEIELDGEIFVDAQCHSNRPAFTLVNGSDKEEFHFYAAMGLPLQHAHICVLLARINSVELAVNFAAFVSSCTPCLYRRSQVKGEVLDTWDAAAESSQLHSHRPLPALEAFLADVQ